MKIKFDLKILLFALIFYFTGQLKIYAFMMIFAFVHEIAHLVISKIMGFKIDQLEIKPLGFSMAFSYKLGDYNRKIGRASFLELKKIFVYLAGPLCNIIMAIIVYFITVKLMQKSNFEIIKKIIFSGIPVLERLGLGNLANCRDFFSTIFYINIFIGVFNLLPIYPLDGGRIFKSMVHIFFDLTKSYIYTERVSQMTTVILLAISSILILKIKNYCLVFCIFYLAYMRYKYSCILWKKIEFHKKILKKMSNESN